MKVEIESIRANKSPDVDLMTVDLFLPNGFMASTPPINEDAYKELVKTLYAETASDSTEGQ